MGGRFLRARAMSGRRWWVEEKEEETPMWAELKRAAFRIDVSPLEVRVFVRKDEPNEVWDSLRRVARKVIEREPWDALEDPIRLIADLLEALPEPGEDLIRISHIEGLEVSLEYFVPYAGYVKWD